MGVTGITDIGQARWDNPCEREHQGNPGLFDFGNFGNFSFGNFGNFINFGNIVIQQNITVQIGDITLNPTINANGGNAIFNVSGFNFSF